MDSLVPFEDLASIMEEAGEADGSQIVEITGLSQPNASNHLACLLDCGLVAREARGRYAFYRLADERVGRYPVDFSVTLGNAVLPAQAIAKVVPPDTVP